MSLTYHTLSFIWSKLGSVGLDDRAHPAAALTPVGLRDDTAIGHNQLGASGADAVAVGVGRAGGAVHAVGQCQESTAGVDEALSSAGRLELDVVALASDGNGADPDFADVAAASTGSALALPVALPCAGDECTAWSECAGRNKSAALEGVALIEACARPISAPIKVSSRHD